MKRKLLYSGIGVFLVLVALYLFTPKTEIHKIEDTQTPSKVVGNQLPNLKLLGVDGSVHFSREFTGKNVLVLYHPDCDHCQREAKEIRTQLSAFENYTVWFISSDSFNNISRFAKDYDLDNHPNVRFVRTEVMEVINNFGSIATPSVYIYSSDRQLIKAINGESSIDEILRYL